MLLRSQVRSATEDTEIAEENRNPMQKERTSHRQLGRKEAQNAQIETEKAPAFLRLLCIFAATVFENNLRPKIPISFLCVLRALCGKGVLAFAFLFFVLSSLAMAQDRPVLFRDNFDSLDNWKPFTFPSPKIRKHSVYTIETNSGESFLRAESNDSASAIIYKEAFNAVEYPKARWRWKVSNIYQKGDARAKTGDDYPIRIYVMFDYDPDKASFGDRILYGLAKARFGAYPPHSSLTYVWANKDEKDRVISSPYTDRVKIILLRMGPKNVGTWQDEDVNILDDYRKAFGTDPPARAHIGIMNDSDNTGESSVSWVDYIEVIK